MALNGAALLLLVVELLLLMLLGLVCKHHIGLHFPHPCFLRLRHLFLWRAVEEEITIRTTDRGGVQGFSPAPQRVHREQE